MLSTLGARTGWDENNTRERHLISFLRQGGMSVDGVLYKPCAAKTKVHYSLQLQ